MHCKNTCHKMLFQDSSVWKFVEQWPRSTYPANAVAAKVIFYSPFCFGQELRNEQKMTFRNFILSSPILDKSKIAFRTFILEA